MRSIQESVAGHFERTATRWDRIYRESSLQARIFHRRRDVALSWIDALEPPGPLRILEVGCGAGAAAVELAQRGHDVCALDQSPAMLRLAHQHALASGVERDVTPILGDTQLLGFRTGTFDLVLALGVLSWLPDPRAALDEMARVTRPGGHVLVTSLNSLEMARLLDPRRTPLLLPLRKARSLAASALGRPRQHKPQQTRYLRRSVRRLLGRSGLVPIREATVGFGPFTALGRSLLSSSYSDRMEESLQRRADTGSALLRSLGRLHLFLSHKPDLA